MRMRVLLLSLTVFGLGACATSPGYYDQGGYQYGSGQCGNCGTVEKIERVYGERQTSGGGAVLGAIIGGALGNQVGKGDGRKAATIAGAVIGGAVGREADANDNPSRTYRGTETRCRVVDSGYDERRIVGYDVEYRYRGEVFFSRLGYDPGEKLRVRVSVEPADP